jgi:hypothetical protein
MVAHNGFTYDLTDTQKAKHLLRRMQKIEGRRKTKQLAKRLLEKWGEINHQFVRDLSEMVFDVEQEAYAK